MHYWSRFDNHAKSIKFAQKTRAAAEERMAQLQAIKGTGLLDVQFLVDASDTVIRNKRILQWLYVYGYFFDAPEGSSDRALFELHQATVRKRAFRFSACHACTRLSQAVRIMSHSLHSLTYPLICYARSVPSFPTLQLEKFTDELHGLTEQSMVSMWNTRAMAVRALALVLDQQLIPRPFAPLPVLLVCCAGGVDEARDARSHAFLLSDRRKVPRSSYRR
jgi:hypothetical protein